MLMEKPKVKFVAIDLNAEMLTATSGCVDNAAATQGGTSCTGNAEHTYGEGCNDTAPMIAD